MFVDMSDVWSVVQSTLRNNSAENGGGAYFENAPQVVADHTAFTANTATVHGGGFVVDGASVVCTDCTVRGCCLHALLEIVR